MAKTKKDRALRQIGAKTPEGCGECEYRRPEWRDGGWCYMFRTMPKHWCAQFKMDGVAPARASAANEQEQRP
jgi:hypothetical protein